MKNKKTAFLALIFALIFSTISFLEAQTVKNEGLNVKQEILTMVLSTRTKQGSVLG